MKGIILQLAFLMLLPLTVACQKQQSSEQIKVNEQEQKFTINKSTGLSHQKAVLRVIHGKIVISFYPEKAPITVKRISKLIKDGFYDGLIFHRVIPNFVAQTGDPTGTGTGGSGKNLPAEFNDIPHVKGTIAMARTQDPNSADSQFYITLSRQEHLDKKYTVFGKVVEGIDVIDNIRKGDKIISMTIE